MFTGIIEEVGTINKIAEKQDIHQYQITASQAYIKNINNGDSVSVNGVCLTAYNKENESFIVDVSQETQHCTSFEFFDGQRQVNLERAVTPTTRLGGHFVSGHVDGTAKVVGREDKENETVIWISTPNNLYKYIAIKGSICIDGVSLTINKIKPDRHCITIIPHTLKNTTFNNVKIDDVVNIEVDLLTRYLEQLLVRHN